jgi:uncharacterized protein (TIGR02246 family)
MRVFSIAVAGFLVSLAGCSPPSSQSFDPDDPAVVAAIESLMAETIKAADAVDPIGVLEPLGESEELTLITGDVMLTGHQTIQEAFADTYDGLLEQNHTVFETTTRLISPDVALYTAIAEGTYTDQAGWVSEPVGLAISVIFVREDGRWVGRHVHQSIAR